MINMKNFLVLTSLLILNSSVFAINEYQVYTKVSQKNTIITEKEDIFCSEKSKDDLMKEMKYKQLFKGYTEFKDGQKIEIKMKKVKTDACKKSE